MTAATLLSSLPCEQNNNVINNNTDDVSQQESQNYASYLLSGTRRTPNDSINNNDSSNEAFHFSGRRGSRYVNDYLTPSLMFLPTAQEGQEVEEQAYATSYRADPSRSATVAADNDRHDFVLRILDSVLAILEEDDDDMALFRPSQGGQRNGTRSNNGVSANYHFDEDPLLQ